MDETLSELRTVSDATPALSVETLLCAAAESVSRARISPNEYTSLLYILTDRIAPYLSHRALPPTSPTCLHFDSVFLNGAAHVAFDALADALRPQTAGADVLARTALLFAAERAGGNRRLAAVLAHAPHAGIAPGRIAAALAHLPSRIANVALATRSAADPTLLDEGDHARALAHAIIAQPAARDPTRDALVTALLGALIRLGCASEVAVAWAAAGDAQRAARASAIAPDTCIVPLLRAFLELPRENSTFSSAACKALLRASATARFAAVQPLQLAKPPLRRPRISVPRLVGSLRETEGSDAIAKALHEAASVWSGQNFAVHADFRLQRHLTRLVLFYIRALYGTLDEKREDVMVVLAQGVTHRLDHGDERIRRYGMVIGEAFSRFCGDEKPLKFPRSSNGPSNNSSELDAEDDGGDSDFSAVANDEERDYLLVESEENILDENPEAGKSSSDIISSNDSPEHNIEKPSYVHGDKKFSKRKRRQAQSSWEYQDTDNAPPAAWELEDDWSSLDGISSSDESDEEELTMRLHATRKDYEAVRAKVGAPMSISRVLGMLRTANSGTDASLDYDAQVVVSTLRTISTRARASRRGDSLYLAAVELCRATFHVASDRFPDEYVDIVAAARRDTVLALATLDIAGVGAFLITDVAVGEHADLSRRSNALSLLTEASRAVSAIVPTQNEPKATKSKAKHPTIQQVGTVTRRHAHSLAARKVHSDRDDIASRALNSFTVCAGKLFFLLANGLSSPRKHSVLAPFAETDPAIYAQSLATLAALLSLAGEGCLQRRDMAQALTELAVRASTHSDTAVRRAAAISAGAAAAATSPSDLAERWTMTNAQVSLSHQDGAADGLFGWLTRASDEDGDALVRRFASIALSRWQRKVQVIADGAS